MAESIEQPVGKQGNHALQPLTGKFNEEEHNRAVESDEGGEENELALISEHFSESDDADDSVDDYEDDDFYDAGESYADDDGGSEGADSGF